MDTAPDATEVRRSSRSRESTKLFQPASGSTKHGRFKTTEFKPHTQVILEGPGAWEGGWMVTILEDHGKEVAVQYGTEEYVEDKCLIVEVILPEAEPTAAEDANPRSTAAPPLQLQASPMLGLVQWNHPGHKAGRFSSSECGLGLACAECHPDYDHRAIADAPCTLNGKPLHPELKS